jgi:hypothetical protein
LPVEDRGIPHLAKNERDVAHPSSVAGTGGLSFLSRLASARRLLGMTKETATFHRNWLPNLGLGYAAIEDQITVLLHSTKGGLGRPAESIGSLLF